MNLKVISILISIWMCVIFCFICEAETVKNIGDDYRFSLTYADSGVHQTGATIPLSIKRGTDGYWFDFDDDTFKASGWTTKTTALTEDSTNHNYHYLWEDQGGETTVNSYAFHVELTNVFIAEETISFQDIGSSVFDNTSDVVILTVETEADIDAILADTNDLQTNQDDWLTATGFATDTDLASMQLNIDDIDENTNGVVDGSGDYTGVEKLIISTGGQ